MGNILVTIFSMCVKLNFCVSRLNLIDPSLCLFLPSLTVLLRLKSQLQTEVIKTSPCPLADPLLFFLD